jgi:hypothetical protein
MRDIHLGFTLEFDTPDKREMSEDFLMRMLGLNCRRNLQFLRSHPGTPKLYDSGIVYAKPDQLDGRRQISRGELRELLALLRRLGADAETALMIVRLLRGVEIFLDTPGLFRRGKGDCNELVPQRVAELWLADTWASPYLVCAPNDRGGFTYHAVVLHEDGSSEDPSLILGMDQPERAADRREEMRKNVERFTNYIAAAHELIRHEGADPDELGRRIEQMGLLPTRDAQAYLRELMRMAAAPARRRAA